MIKKKLVTIALLVCFSQPAIYSLTKVSASVAGTAASLVTTGIASLFIKNWYARLGIFGVSEAAWVTIFLQYTPENRYTWAIKKIDKLSQESLFNAKLDQESFGLVLQDAGCESYELPLVAAFLRLQYYDKELVHIDDELTRALSDLTSPSSLSYKIDKLRSLIKPHLKRVHANEAFIKQQPQWLDQWRLYQERALAKEQLEVYQRLNTHVVWHLHR